MPGDICRVKMRSDCKHKWPSMSHFAWYGLFVVNSKCSLYICTNIDDRFLPNLPLLCRTKYSLRNNGVKMSAMVSQITGVSIIFWNVCSGTGQRYIEALRHWPLWGAFTGGFPSPRANYAENVSLWWHHHTLHCDIPIIDCNWWDTFY